MEDSFTFPIPFYQQILNLKVHYKLLITFLKELNHKLLITIHKIDSLFPYTTNKSRHNFGENLFSFFIFWVGKVE